MSTRALRISEDLSLPVDAATQTMLIFGKRGSGKSSTATRIAEQMIAAKVPVFVKQLGAKQFTEFQHEAYDVEIPGKGIRRIRPEKSIISVKAGSGQAILAMGASLSRIRLPSRHKSEPAAPLFGVEKVKAKRRDSKGGDIETFPDDLKVRQFPATAEARAK